MTRLLLVIMSLFLPLKAPIPALANVLEGELKESVKYLDEIPEIKWVKVKKNSVIIGWKGLPSGFNLINTEAALKGTEAIDRAVNIWSVRHTQKKWIVGTRPYLCKTTASRGKIQETSCNF